MRVLIGRLYRRRCPPVLTALVSTLFAAACASIEPPPCDREPALLISTVTGGAEDMVGLPMAGDATRLLVREGCAAAACERTGRIGYFDVKRDTIGNARCAPDATCATTQLWWRPPERYAQGRFSPLGLSLLAGAEPGTGVLFLIDRVKPVRIWRIVIDNGMPSADARSETFSPWFVADPRDDRFDAVNDLQAVGDHVYLTRFDVRGLFHRSADWQGLLAVESGTPPRLDRATESGLHGANGVALIPQRALLVSDYWRRRVRIVPLDHSASSESTFELAINPDNLTFADNKLYIAGQRYPLWTFLNLLASGIPSPSEVYAVPIDASGSLADKPELLWSGGWTTGRSISVAVPVPGGLALGQIAAPNVLLVACRRE